MHRYDNNHTCKNDQRAKTKQGNKNITNGTTNLKSVRDYQYWRLEADLV